MSYDNSHDPVLDLEPKDVWKYFYEISRIPRCSRNEEGIRRYLIDLAGSRGLSHRSDEAGNIVIEIPATSGYENKPTVVLQGHMDMVCEKNKGSEHDFSLEPLSLGIEEEGLVYAEGTTLGADNGVALAMGLALLDTDSPHGPLELLFTVDEESGLTGAMELDPSLINGRILLNLDSEEEGVFYIGCAGGGTTAGELPLEWSSPNGDQTALSLSITGLAGGHSGANIHEGRGNAVKLGARLLWTLKEEYPLSLARIEGGGKHNVIPREFTADFTVSESHKTQTMEKIREIAALFAEELGDIEPNLSVDVDDTTDPPEKVLSPKSSSRTINTLYLIPHGADEMSRAIEGLVETSNNLASVSLQEYHIRILTSQRSSLMSKRDEIRNRVTAALRTGGAKVHFLSEYPAWTPDPDNPLIPVCTEAYRHLFEKEPKVTAIHAGLESGVIGDKFDQMKMISFGPNLYNVHTPQESVDSTSVLHIWKMLLRILENIED